MTEGDKRNKAHSQLTIKAATTPKPFCQYNRLHFQTTVIQKSKLENFTYCTANQTTRG